MHCFVLWSSTMESISAFLCESKIGIKSEIEVLDILISNKKISLIKPKLANIVRKERSNYVQKFFWGALLVLKADYHSYSKLKKVYV